jgi:dTDP-4-dehydrorhamnose 3,5-epimerase
MRVEETGIPGCRIVHGDVRRDARGWFLKTFHEPAHAELGLRTDWREEYVSLSHRGVVRGIHFQTPPADHAKLVTCLAGEVIDVVLDLRRGSPTFGEHRAIPMSGETGVSVYAPSGVAHGFAALRDDSMMFYKVTSVHAPANDAGIAWDSFGFDWPVDTPIVSERDRQHPPLASFDSPFRFDPANAAR